MRSGLLRKWRRQTVQWCHYDLCCWQIIDGKCGSHFQLKIAISTASETLDPYYAPSISFLTTPTIACVADGVRWSQEKIESKSTLPPKTSWNNNSTSRAGFTFLPHPKACSSWFLIECNYSYFGFVQGIMGKADPSFPASFAPTLNTPMVQCAILLDHLQYYFFLSNTWDP